MITPIVAANTRMNPIHPIHIHIIVQNAMPMDITIRMITAVNKSFIITDF